MSVEPTADVLDLGVARLVHLDQRIDANEGDALRARWEFGHELLAKREGKQLPRGLLAKVCEQTGKSRTELKYRMLFAERFATEVEVVNAIDHFRSWYQVVNRALSSAAAVADVEIDPDALVVPEGKFATIVADPPWQYSNRATRGAAEDHYQTMTIEDLCDLDIAPEKAADSAHLYLWTTSGFLREAFTVMDAWGFTYKANLVWAKPQMGMGNYFRISHEHVLFGVKGNLGTRSRSVMSWFEARREKHSAKPDSFYDLVEKASPGPYLDMFARRRRLGDWETWGAEA